MDYSDSGDKTQSYNSKHVARTASACDNCRKRKTKCSGRNPCEYCHSHELECCFTYVKKRRTKYKKQPEELPNSNTFDSRLSRLESQITALTSNLDLVIKMVQKLSDSKLKLNNDMESESVSVTSSGSWSRSSDQMQPSRNKEDKHGLGATSGKLMGEFIELIQFAGSTSIFNQKSLKGVKNFSRDNFELFKPVLAHHSLMLKGMTQMIKRAFNETESHSLYLFQARVVISKAISYVMGLNLQSFFISRTGQVESIQRVVTQFQESSLVAPNFTHSEYLILSAIICLSCVHVAHKKLNEPDFIDPDFDFRELERVAVRNCFYHFHHLVHNCEGEETVMGILLLCGYLKTTVFSRSTILILSVACKHIKKLRYQEIDISADTDISTRNINFIRKMLWIKCFMLDRDFSCSFEKPSIMDTSVTDKDFVEAMRVSLVYNIEQNPKYGAEELATLNSLTFDSENRVNDLKALLQAAHSYATFSTQGFTILRNLYTYSLSEIVTKYNKNPLLLRVKKLVAVSDISFVCDEEYFSTFFNSLDVIQQVNKDFEHWESCIPENIRPGCKLDISQYQLAEEVYSAGKHPLELEKPYEINPSKSDIKENSLSFFLVNQCAYYYSRMKANKLCQKSSYLILKRLATSKSPDATIYRKRINMAFATKFKTFEKTYVQAATSILQLSSYCVHYNCQVTFWGTRFTMAAFFIMFSHIMGRFLFDSSLVYDENGPEECLNELYLLIDCYLLCISQPVFRIRHFDQDFVEVFGRRTILLCLENLKERMNHDFSTDYKVLEFFNKCSQNGKSVSVETPINIEDSLLLDGTYNNFSIGFAKDSLNTNNTEYISATNKIQPPVSTPAESNTATSGLFIFDGQRQFPSIDKSNGNTVGSMPLSTTKNTTGNFESVTVDIGGNKINNNSNNNNNNTNNIYNNRSSLVAENIFLDLNDIDPFSVNGFSGDFFSENDFPFNI